VPDFDRYNPGTRTGRERAVGASEHRAASSSGFPEVKQWNGKAPWIPREGHCLPLSASRYEIGDFGRGVAAIVRKFR
jgi:hypothetical protein